MDLLSKFKSIQMSFQRFVSIMLVIYGLIALLMIAGGFGAYYFYSYEAVNGEPESNFTPKEFSSSDLRRVEELLRLRSERFQTSTTSQSFIGAFR